jgi:hypothetical protein
LIPQLPQRNRDILARWMRFYEKILVHKVNNHLNPKTLATTLGINLSRQDDIQGFKDIPHLNVIVEDMIKNSKELFPAALYKQMSEDVIKNVGYSPRNSSHVKIKKLFNVSLTSLPTELPEIIERLIYFVESNCKENLFNSKKTPKRSTSI